MMHRTNKLECLFMARPFLPSLMFTSKVVRAYPSGAYTSYSTQLACSTNIRIDWSS